MRNKMSNVLKEYPLEIRILIIAAIGGMGFAIFTGLTCVFLELGPLLIGSSIGTGIVGMITLYYAIVKKSYRIPVYFGVLTLMVIFYPFMWIVNGGSHGPMFFYMIFNAVFCSILMAYLNYKIVLVIQLFIVYGLLALEQFIPSMIVPYHDSVTRSIDIGFSFTIVFLVTFYMVVRIMNEYNHSISELEQVKRQLMETNKRLLLVSETDELTGISNRRYIMNHLGALIGSNEVTGIGLIMMDIDYFKNINDTYGHSVGDEVIKVVSTVLSDNISNQDTIGRIGGEEFLIVMPGVVMEEAYKTAENLRASIEALSWDHLDMKVTISGGVYCKQYSESLDELLEKVDQQLYASKNKGRNQISCC